MKLQLRTPALAIIAILFGAIVLMGYFISPLHGVLEIIVNIARVLTAVVLLVGILNLTLVHLKKIRTDEKNGIYSLFLVAALVLTFVVAILFGPGSPWTIWIFDHVLQPVEASLVALLAVLLIYALARMFWRGVTLVNLVFAVTVLFMLAVPLLLSFISFPLLSALHNWVSQVFALAGARAILMGVALGIIATGLRILTGADRPYEG